MLEQCALGIALMIVATMVHATCTGLSLKVLLNLDLDAWALRSGLNAAIFVACVVAMLFLATLVETMIWAVAYWGLGALEGFEEALYFSTVTYTTLGFGDITLSQEWRLLSSFEAAIGVILLGWSTAIVFAFVQHIISIQYASRKKLGG